jgi:hypothetical protein
LRRKRRRTPARPTSPEAKIVIDTGSGADVNVTWFRLTVDDGFDLSLISICTSRSSAGLLLIGLKAGEKLAVAEELEAGETRKAHGPVEVWAADGVTVVETPDGEVTSVTAAEALEEMPDVVLLPAIEAENEDSVLVLDDVESVRSKVRSSNTPDVLAAKLMSAWPDVADAISKERVPPPPPNTSCALAEAQLDGTLAEVKEQPEMVYVKPPQV